MILKKVGLKILHLLSFEIGQPKNNPRIYLIFYLSKISLKYFLHVV